LGLNLLKACRAITQMKRILQPTNPDKTTQPGDVAGGLLTFGPIDPAGMSSARPAAVSGFPSVSPPLSLNSHDGFDIGQEQQRICVFRGVRGLCGAGHGVSFHLRRGRPHHATWTSFGFGTNVAEIARP
jgi:hypothetical protein